MPDLNSVAIARQLIAAISRIHVCNHFLSLKRNGHVCQGSETHGTVQ